jgi:hypothetical protein
MAIERLSLSKSLAVSTLAVWIASIICFYLLDFRDQVLVRTLGPTITYLLVGSAYPLVVAFPLSRLVSTKPTVRFVVIFSVLFVVAVIVMATVLVLVPGVIGGYAAGATAISCLGSGIACYLDRRSNFLRIGFLLASWAFLGDYIGYNSRHVLGGPRGIVIYASIYSLFLGSGLGTLLWHVQLRPNTALHPAAAAEDKTGRG